MKDLHALAREARAAAWELAACPLEKRNAALNAMAETLLEDRAEIFQANQEDLRRAQEEGLAAPLVKRALGRRSSTPWWRACGRCARCRTPSAAPP